MTIQSLLRVAAMALMLCCPPLYAADEGADADVRAVDRIENAYRTGFAKAGTPREKLECSEIRSHSLAMLAEVSYQSTVAWLVERGELIEVLAADQKQWAATHRGFLDKAERKGVKPVVAMAAYEAAAEMALARIKVFRAITGSTLSSSPAEQSL